MKRFYLISFTLLLLVCRNGFSQDDFWLASGELPDGAVESLAIDRFDKTLYAAVLGSGMYKSIDNGATWIEKNNGLTGTSAKLIKAVAINSNGFIYAATNGSGVYRSTDKGDSWTEVNNGLTNTNVLSLNIFENGDIYVGTWFTGHVFKSTNNGNNWSEIGVEADVLSVLHTRSGYTFAGTTHFGIYRKADNEDEWEVVGLKNKDVNAFAVNSAGTIFAATSKDGIYRSTNDGEAWIQIISGMTHTSVNALLVNESDRIFAGTNQGGVFRSYDNGGTWIQENTGLGNLFVFSFVQDSSWKVYAGTGRGVYKSLRSTSPVSEYSENSFSHYSYPNPFIEKVRIQFYLSSPEKVSISIYDNIGSEVAVLCDKLFINGNHFIDWNPKGKESGLYFYKIKTGKNIETGKMIYLK